MEITPLKRGVNDIKRIARAAAREPRLVSLGIGHSLVIGHWSLVIGHSHSPPVALFHKARKESKGVGWRWDGGVGCADGHDARSRRRRPDPSDVRGGMRFSRKI